MKKSFYTQEVSYYNQQENKHKTIVYSTRSCKIRLVNSSLWQDIKNKNFINVNQKTKDDLFKNKFIVDKDDNELDLVISENKNAISNDDVLYYSIQPTATCQLGCGYCGQEHKNNFMDKTLQEKTLQQIEEKLKKSTKIKKLAISWFGAEPLTAINIITSMSQKLLELARRYKLEYTAQMTTNGVLLNKKNSAIVFNDCKISSIELTLDGTEISHDKRRMTKSGQKTFTKIYTNLKNFLSYKYNCLVKLRCNVDSENYDSVELLINRLKQDKFHDKIVFYTAPIHGWGNGAEKLALENKKFAQKQISWFIKMHQDGFKLNILPSRRKILCMATSKENELIDPYGGRFNCTEVSLVPNYIKDDKNIHQIGHVNITAVDTIIKDNFAGFNDEILQNKFPCSKCKLLPVCGGACPKEWKEKHVPCPAFKFNFEQRLLLLLTQNKVTKVL